jgi:hypothetical protein
LAKDLLFVVRMLCNAISFCSRVVKFLNVILAIGLIDRVLVDMKTRKVLCKPLVNYANYYSDVVRPELIEL